MSSIALPHESLWIPYLKGLKDTDLLMRSSREVQNDSNHKGVLTDVTYKDIKDTPMTTAYDFLKILFDREDELFLNSLTQNDSLVWNPGKKQVQWDSIYNEEEGTIKVTSEEVDDSVFSSRLNFKFHCHFVLRKDMCDLFGWTKYTKYQSTIIAKHGPNLVMRKRDNAFFEDRTDSQHYGYRYGLLEAVVQGKDGAYVDSIAFYLDEFTHTFTNLKECTYKN
ncbi:hypothetical protein AWC38_SpisGene24755, partial [Stylophora pistillata]